MAPPQPGTVVPGPDGMTDAATANGDDRDPEIELFVKVGRRPGSRRTCCVSSPAPGGAGSRVPRRGPLGLRTFPRERSPALAVPWVAFLQARAGLRGSRAERSQVQSGRWLSSWRVGRQFVRGSAGQAVTAAGPELCPELCWLFLKGTSRCREMARTWLDPGTFLLKLRGVGMGKRKQKNNIS